MSDGPCQSSHEITILAVTYRHNLQDTTRAYQSPSVKESVSGNAGEASPDRAMTGHRCDHRPPSTDECNMNFAEENMPHIPKKMV